MDNTIQPEDEINGFQLTDTALPLFTYALHLKTLDFELPTSWWQSHIVSDADDVLERSLFVEGPVLLAHNVDIFTGWKSTCRNSMNYIDAAFAGLMDMYDRFGRMLEHASQAVGDFEYAFNLPADQQWLNRNAVLFFERARLLTVVRNDTLKNWQIGLHPEVRKWVYNKHNMPLKLAFAQWQNEYCAQNQYCAPNNHLVGINKQQIHACVNQYLSVNFPQKFGGSL